MSTQVKTRKKQEYKDVESSKAKASVMGSIVGLSLGGPVGLIMGSSALDLFSEERKDTQSFSKYAKKRYEEGYRAGYIDAKRKKSN